MLQFSIVCNTVSYGFTLSGPIVALATSVRHNQKSTRRNDFTLSYPKALAVFSLSRDLQRDRPKHNFGHQFESKLLIRYSAH